MVLAKALDAFECRHTFVEKRAPFFRGALSREPQQRYPSHIAYARKTFPMPLKPSSPRRAIHHRCIDMHSFEREDGLYDVEARLVDTKPFAFERIGMPMPVPAGQALHDLWVRLTVDDQFEVREVSASSDTTPYSICREAEDTLQVLVGDRIARGWSARVKEKLRGAASCTHLAEMLIPLATVVLQGIRGLRSSDQRRSDDEATAKVDSCYAYGRQRKVVLKLWPQFYVPAADSVSTEPFGTSKRN